MFSYTLTLADGTVVGAGAEGPAIISLRRTASGFSGTQLDPGAVVASELELELFTGGQTVTAGDTLLLHRDGTLLGTFLAEKPTVTAPGRMKLLAYDCVTRLDADLTDWLESLTGWPYTLEHFGAMVCQACGLSLSGDLLNAQWEIPRFQARGVTGRQLMQWVCQAGGRFCRAAPDGTLTLSWLRQRDLTLSPTGDSFYYQGTLAREDYSAAAVDGVQIALTDSDVGVIYPASPTNCLRIQGNYLLCGCGEAEAQALLEGLGGLSYTPCSLTTPTALDPGDIFTVVSEGGSFTAVAMTVEHTLERCTVRCTGAASRNEGDAVCSGRYETLSGRVLELQLALQGITSRMAEFAEETVRLSQLTVDVDGVTARVGVLERDADALGQSLEELSQSAQQRYAQLALRSDNLEISVGTLRSDLDGKADGTQLQDLAEHFLFDEKGLTISDTATGMSVQVSEEQIAFSGTTCIYPDSLQTTNLKVSSSLSLGAFRFFPRSNGNLSLRYTG